MYPQASPTRRSHGVNVCVIQYSCWHLSPQCDDIWWWGHWVVIKLRWGHEFGMDRMALEPFWEEENPPSLSLSLSFSQLPLPATPSSHTQTKGRSCELVFHSKRGSYIHVRNPFAGNQICHHLDFGLFILQEFVGKDT